MAGRRGPQIQTLAPDEQERLATIRAEASQQQSDLLTARAPADTLGALAWIAGAVGPAPLPPLDIVMNGQIEQARRDGFTWRQIASAVGEGESADDARRVRDRFTSATKEQGGTMASRRDRASE